MTTRELTIAQRIDYSTELSGYGTDMPDRCPVEETMITRKPVRCGNGAADTWTNLRTRCAHRGDNTWG